MYEFCISYEIIMSKLKCNKQLCYIFTKKIHNLNKNYLKHKLFSISCVESAEKRQLEELQVTACQTARTGIVGRGIVKRQRIVLERRGTWRTVNETPRNREVRISSFRPGEVWEVDGRKRGSGGINGGGKRIPGVIGQRVR